MALDFRFPTAPAGKYFAWHNKVSVTVLYHNYRTTSSTTYDTLNTLFHMTFPHDIPLLSSFLCFPFIGKAYINLNWIYPCLYVCYMLII